MSDSESDSEVHFNITNHNLNEQNANDGSAEGSNNDSHIDSQSDSEINEEQSSVAIENQDLVSPVQPYESHEGRLHCLTGPSDSAQVDSHVYSKPQPSQQNPRLRHNPRRLLSEVDQRSRRHSRDVGNPDRRFRPDNRHVDMPGRHHRVQEYNVDKPDQQESDPYISASNRHAGIPSRYVSNMQRRARAPQRSTATNADRCFETRQRYYSSPRRNFRSVSRHTHSPDYHDHSMHSPRRRVQSPSSPYLSPIRHSHYRSHHYRSQSKHSYSPKRQRLASPNHQRRMHGYGRGDANQSNQSLHIPSGRPDSPQYGSLGGPCPDVQIIDSDPYDSSSDLERSRPGILDFPEEQVYNTTCYLGGPKIRPEPYTGSENWEEYQSHFEDCAELSKWDNRSKVLFLAASLRGQARTYYMSLDIHERRSYSSLVYRMRQRFGSSRHAIKWLNQLELRQRKSGESITALGDDLRQLAKKAYRNLDTNAQETLALNQLYKLIPVDMKCRCIDHDCKSVQQAVEVIERYEAILGEAAQERKKTNVRNMDQMPQPQNSDPNISNILKKLDSRLEKLESMSLAHQISGRENPQWRPNVNNRNKKCCFYCSSPDHMVRNCPEKIRQGSRPRYPDQSNNQPYHNNPRNVQFRGQQDTIMQAPHFHHNNHHRQSGPVPQFNPQPTIAQENGQLSTQ